jgi:predicted transcriptional regulator of viral defense system
MKKTALSKKELNILENVIAKHGYVVSFDDLARLIESKSHDVLKHQISSLAERGWLVRIKRGYYAVANLESHNFSNVSPLVISQVLVPDSYVSFEFALNYRGHFNQLLAKVTSVTSSNTRKFKFQNIDYSFVKAKPEMIKGFEEISIEGQNAKVAVLEKALLDFLHYRKNTYTIDLLVEKLNEVRTELDTGKMIELSMTYPITLRRRLGFLLDLTGLNSESLSMALNGTPGYTKLTKKSNIFNAKWRLYYEDRFAE